MAEVVIRNNNVTVQVTQPGTTETVTVLQGPTGSTGAPGVVQSIVPGTNITVNSTDPANPVVSASGGSAAATTFTPAGNIAATNVQAALQELDTEKSSTGHTHAASAITFTPTGNIAATNVQAALAEVDSEKETPSGAQAKANSAVSTHVAASDPHGDRAYADSNYMKRETSARTVYVATTGSDTTGDGTFGNPWATIQHAVDQVRSLLLPQNGASGYTITVSPGTYTQTITIPPTIFGAFIETGGGGIVIKSSTGVATDVTIRSSDGFYGINAFGPCSLSYLTIESDDIGVLVRGGAHVQVVIDNCVIRRITVADGGTAAIYSQLACILSRVNTTTTGRRFTNGLYAYAGGVIAKANSTQPTGAVANEKVAAGGVIR